MNKYIKTERLILRPWKETDLLPFANLNSDPRVMKYLHNTLTLEESNKFAKTMITEMEQYGWGRWAVSIPRVSDFIGYIGLTPVDFASNFAPAINIEWRLAYDFWNQGYATEGAREVLKYGFETLELNEIVSFTSIDNVRSRRIMDKIGMSHDENGDFEHPKLPIGHKLRQHVLYKANNTAKFVHVWKTPPENFKSQCEVSACVLEIDDKILLLERSYRESESKTWGLPGGKFELGETPLQAAIRELFEETSIHVHPADVKEVIKVYVQKPKGDFVFHMFEIKLNEVPKVILNAEHTQYKWVNDKEIEMMNLIDGGREALFHYKKTKT